MRARGPWIFLLLTVALLPTGAGQDPVEPEAGMVTLFEDPEEDAMVKSGDAEVPVQPWPTVDLRSLSWEETPEDLRVQIGLAALEQDRPEAFIVDDVNVDVRFSHGDMHYLVRFRMTDLVDDPDYYATLYHDDPTAAFPTYLQALPVEVDADANTLTAPVPRADILDQDGAPLNLDDTVTGIWARSESVAVAVTNTLVSGYTLDTATVEVTDTVPDGGADGAAEWAIQHGVEQVGHLALYSDRPFRLSNGEATTFLYEVRLENDAGFPDTVTLDHSTAPQGWMVTFPEKEVRIDAGETVDLPVLLTVPFNHEHGTVHSMEVTGQSRADPQARAHLELGVRYTEIPQPAGHHDTLHIHLGPSGAYMNTEAEHDGATGEPDANSGFGSDFVSYTYTWAIPLAPPLGIGLDFDLERTGTLQMPVTVGGGAVEGYAHGTLVLRQADRQAFFGYREEPLATLPDTEPRMIIPGEETVFELEVRPQAAADHVPYVADSALFLHFRITLTGTAPGLNPSPTAASLQPGGVMELPLNEFHDDVDDYFASLSGVELIPVSSQQRFVNPGETILFEVDAENVGALEGTFDLDLTGTHTEWTRILGDPQIHLGPGAKRPMAVAVSPPDSAVDGELVDVTLHASKSDDPNVRSLIRFLAEVDTDEDHPDESLDADDVDAQLRSQKTPGPWIGLVGLALLGLAARRRR